MPMLHTLHDAVAVDRLLLAVLLSWKALGIPLVKSHKPRSKPV